MEHIDEHPGTLSVSEWLEELNNFQQEAGRGALPTQQEGRPLCQWVERMRRMAHAGLLPTSLAIDLARHGIRLAQDVERGQATNSQADAAFRKNMTRLKGWMDADCRVSQRKAARLTYVGSRTERTARQCYTFMEHMRLKMRQGLLTSDHYWDLVNLPLLINGGSVSNWLDVGPSQRRQALGEELKVDEFQRVNDVRLDAELVVRKGDRGEVYVAGAGTLLVVVSDGGLETPEGYAVRTSDWRRLFLEDPGEPTLVFLPDMDRHGVLSFQRPLREVRTDPLLHTHYAKAARKAHSERLQRRHEREDNPFGWARGTKSKPVPGASV